MWWERGIERGDRERERESVCFVLGGESLEYGTWQNNLYRTV